MNCLVTPHKGHRADAVKHRPTPRLGSAAVGSLVLVALLSPLPATAQETDATTPTSVSDVSAELRSLEGLRQLTREGRWAEAMLVAEDLRREYEGEPAFDFQYGLVLLANNDPAAAVYPLERVIMDQPANSRARLELGRAYFELGRWLDARNQFQRVQATQPPPGVQANINRYLVAIDQRERDEAGAWRGTASVLGLYQRQSYGNEIEVGPGTFSIDDSDDYRLLAQVDVRREFRRSNFVTQGFGFNVSGGLEANGDVDFADPDLGVRVFHNDQRNHWGYRASLEARVLSQSLRGRIEGNRELAESVEGFLRYEPIFNFDGPVNEQFVNRVTVGSVISDEPRRLRTTLSAEHRYNLRTGSDSENSDAEKGDLFSTSFENRFQFLLDSQWTLEYSHSVTLTHWLEDNAFNQVIGDEDRRRDLTVTALANAVWVPRPQWFTRTAIGYQDTRSNIKLYGNSGPVVQLTAAYLW